MKVPENGASMHDAARTRENEGLCICDACQYTDACSHDAEAACNKALSEAMAEQKAEDARELGFL